jgi:hypothetical protein
MIIFEFRRKWRKWVPKSTRRPLKILAHLRVNKTNTKMKSSTIVLSFFSNCMPLISIWTIEYETTTFYVHWRTTPPLSSAPTHIIKWRSTQLSPILNTPPPFLSTHTHVEMKAYASPILKHPSPILQHPHTCWNEGVRGCLPWNTHKHLGKHVRMHRHLFIYLFIQLFYFIHFVDHFVFFVCFLLVCFFVLILYVPFLFLFAFTQCDFRQLDLSKIGKKLTVYSTINRTILFIAWMLKRSTWDLTWLTPLRTTCQKAVARKKFYLHIVIFPHFWLVQAWFLEGW